MVSVSGWCNQPISMPFNEQTVFDIASSAFLVSCLTGKDELPQHYRERMLYLF